jgi:hypothetical protein
MSARLAVLTLKTLSLSAVLLAQSAYALQVSVSANGTVRGVGPDSILLNQGANNGNEPTVTSASYSLLSQPGVADSNPPLFYLYQLEGAADSKQGTLKSMVAISNTGGQYSQANGDVTSKVVEHFQIKPGSIGNIAGTTGVGTSGDDFVTVRARAALDGSLFAGSPTGIPVGAEPGSARGSMFLGMGQYNGSNSATGWGQLTLSQSNIAPSTAVSIRNDGLAIIDTGPIGMSPPTNIGSFSVAADGSYVEMLIKQDWIEATQTFNGGNTYFTVFQSLLAAAEVGNFPGAQAVADYSNTGYFDLEVEAGYSLKTLSATFAENAQIDSFLSGGQGSGQVSAPGTLGLLLASGLMAWSVRRPGSLRGNSVGA